MGVLGRVDRDLPTGVGEGPPRSPTAEAAAAHRVGRPGSPQLVKSCRPISEGLLPATMLRPSGLGSACQALKSARVSTRPVTTSLALTPFGWSTNANSPGPGSRWLTQCPGSCRCSERLPLPVPADQPDPLPWVAGVAHGVVPAKLHAGGCPQNPRPNSRASVTSSDGPAAVSRRTAHQRVAERRCPPPPETMPAAPAASKWTPRSLPACRDRDPRNCGVADEPTLAAGTCHSGRSVHRTSAPGSVNRAARYGASRWAVAEPWLGTKHKSWC